MNASIINVKEKSTGEIYQCVLRFSVSPNKKQISALFDVGNIINGEWNSVEILNKDRFNEICEYVGKYNDR